MKKKILVALLSAVAAVCFAFGFAACTPGGGEGGGGGEEGGGGHTHSYSYQSNNDGATHKVVCVAAGCPSPEIDPAENCSDGDSDGDCDKCGQQIGSSVPTGSYSVQFDVNGGYPLVPFRTCESGADVSAPAEPEKVGYDFGGWYTDVNLGSEAQFPYTVNGDVTFYAKWNAQNKTTVRFAIAVFDRELSSYGNADIDYSQEILAPVEVAKNSKFDQPQNPKDITYTDSSEKVHTMKFSFWSFYSTYERNRTAAVLFPVEIGDKDEMTLYAVYTEVNESDTYASLTVHPQNGEKVTMVYGVMGKNLPIATPSSNNKEPFYSYYQYAQHGVVDPLYEGHSVSGYFKSEEFTSENLYPIPFMLNNEENDVYLRWEEEDDLQITFDYGYGEKTSNVTVKYRGLIPRIADPVRVGYTFDGWYSPPMSPANEETRWDFECGRAVQSGTLKAKWVKTAAVITFDVRGGSPINPVAVEKGTTVTSLPTAERISKSAQQTYNFLGWFRDSGCTQNALAGGGLDVDGDITVYAGWSEVIDISYFKFDQNGIDYSISVAPEHRADISGRVVLPAKYNGSDVKYVQTEGFKDCNSITEVVIPESVKYVYNNAFAGCSELKKVVLPDGLVQLAWDVFVDCPLLADVNFPAGDEFRYIVSDVFRDCPEMRKKFDKVPVGSASAQLSYWGTACLGVGYGVDDDEDDGKADNFDVQSVTEITVREGTTIVASYAFYNCSKLETLTFADSVKYAVQYVFPNEKKSSLKTLNLSASYMITPHEQNYPATLETITVPASNPDFYVTDGCLMYKGDSRLVASTVSADSIPAGTKIIGKKSFCNKNLDNVVIPSTVTDIYARAFEGGQYTEFDIPDSVGVLAEDALYNCKKLETLNMGKNVPLMAKAFFTNILGVLSVIDIDADNPNMLSNCGIVYNKVTAELIYSSYSYRGEFTPWERCTSLDANDLRGHYTVFNLTDNIENIESGSLEVEKLVLGKKWSDREDVFGLLFEKFTQLGDGFAANMVTEVVLAEGATMRNVGGVIYNAAMTKILFTESDLTELDIADTVTEISNETEAYNVTSLHVGAGISLEEFAKLVYGYPDESWFGMGMMPAMVFPETVTVAEGNRELTSIDNVVYTKDRTQLVYIPANYNGALVLPREMQSAVLPFGAMTALFAPGTDGEEFAELTPNSVHITELKAESGSVLSKIGVYAFAPAERYASWPDEELVSSIPEWFVYYSEGNFDYSVEDIGFAIDRVDLREAETLAQICAYSFCDLSTLTEVLLPASVNYFGSYCFNNCGELKKIEGADFAEATIDGGLMYDYGNFCDENGYVIMGGALLGYKPQTEPDKIELPGDVTVLQGGALILRSAHSLYVPKTVTKALKNSVWVFSTGFIIYLEATEEEMATFAFDGEWYLPCRGDVMIVYGYKTAAKEDYPYVIDETTGLMYSLDRKNNTARLVSDAYATAAWTGAVELPAEITAYGKQYALTGIGAYALSGETVTSVTLPDSIAEIGESAFDTCRSLEKIVTSDNASYKAVDGILYNKELTAFVHIPACLGGDVTIPDTITFIGSWTFSERKIVSLNTGNGVSEIGLYAFENCTSLTDVTIGNGVASLGSSCFDGCTALRNVTLGSGLTSISSGAFSDCSALESVTFAAEDGWQVSARANMSNARQIDVSDAAQNAQWLKTNGAYTGYYWKRVAE